MASPDADLDTAAVQRPWQAISVCLVAAFMVLLDVSIVNVALPSIQQGLDASASDLQWVLSGYALTFGLALVPAGRLGDARGRRTIFIIGLALFTVTSAAAGLAPTALALSLARLVQGVAGGLITPQTAGFIQELFRGNDRGRAFGLLGATIGISTAVGPVLGGVIIALAGEDDGWRWIFYVNVPVGIVAIVLARRLLPPPHVERHESLDPVGVVLLGIGVLLLLLPLVEERTWEGNTKWLLVPAAFVMLTGFVWWERWWSARGHEPLILLDLFRVRSYVLGAALALAYFAGFTSIFFIFTLYLQNGLGLSPLEAGLAITPFALGSAVASGVSGRSVTQRGRRLVVLGLVLVVVGLLLADVAVHVVDGSRTGWATALPLAVAGVGSGLVIAPNQTLTLAAVPIARAGSAAAVVQMGQRIGTAIGIAAVGAMFFASLASTRGDFQVSFERGLAVSIGFIVIALVIGLIDVIGDRPRTPSHAKGRS